MKTTDLDEFDGSDVSGFALSVQAARAMFPTDAVASIMARNLRGMAKIWFQNIENTPRNNLLLNAEDFLRSLRAEFEVDKSIARQTARDRKWNHQKESILDYFYDKVKMVSNSYGERMDEADKCHEVREGLPDDFKPFICTPLSGRPTLEHLRKELKLLELDYLASKRKKPLFQVTSLPSNQQFSSNVPKPIKPESGSPVRRVAGQRIPLKDSFNPKMIGQSPNPANPSQMIRTYTIPDGSGRVLMLNRPCRSCGGNHFDFEPVHALAPAWSEQVSEDSYPSFTSVPAGQSSFRIDYPAFVPQSVDPSVRTTQAAYPSWNDSSTEVSNEDFAYHMMRHDRYESLSPSSFDSSRFEEEDSNSTATSSSPSQSKK